MRGDLRRDLFEANVQVGQIIVSSAWLRGGSCIKLIYLLDELLELALA
jgi:hypothetical protein